MKFGYTLLYVEDVAKSMEFYENALGLKRSFIHENEYGEMETGGTKLGFVHHEVASTHGFEYVKWSAESKCCPFEIAFVTEDVNNAYLRAIRAGAIPIAEPKIKPWGQMVCYVRDCNGFTIELCTPME